MNESYCRTIFVAFVLAFVTAFLIAFVRKCRMTIRELQRRRAHDTELSTMATNSNHIAMQTAAERNLRVDMIRRPVTDMASANTYVPASEDTYTDIEEPPYEYLPSYNSSLGSGQRDIPAVPYNLTQGRNLHTGAIRRTTADSAYLTPITAVGQERASGAIRRTTADSASVAPTIALGQERPTGAIERTTADSASAASTRGLGQDTYNARSPLPRLDDLPPSYESIMENLIQTSGNGWKLKLKRREQNKRHQAERKRRRHNLASQVDVGSVLSAMLPPPYSSMQEASATLGEAARNLANVVSYVPRGGDYLTLLDPEVPPVSLGEDCQPLLNPEESSDMESIYGEVSTQRSHPRAHASFAQPHVEIVRQNNRRSQ